MASLQRLADVIHYQAMFCFNYIPKSNWVTSLCDVEWRWGAHIIIVYNKSYIFLFLLIWITPVWVPIQHRLAKKRHIFVNFIKNHWHINSWNRFRQTPFHHNNKSVKCLANLIKQNIEKTMSVIKDSAGKPTHIL